MSKKRYMQRGKTQRDRHRERKREGEYCAESRYLLFHMNVVCISGYPVVQRRKQQLF